MSALHHLLRRSAGALALVLAFAVLLGSLCPRGWFVCVHEQELALVDAHHAQELAHEQDGHDGCGEIDCCPTDSEGCLDLALSLVLDDQTAAFVVWGSLPTGEVLSVVPDLKTAALNVCSPHRDIIGGPPPSPFITHIRLLV